jgi:hypothetical protein
MDIEIFRSVCLAFPAVTEEVKWGNDLCFCVGEKMFCVANLEPPHSFSFKVTDAEFGELSGYEDSSQRLIWPGQNGCLSLILRNLVERI